MTFHFTSLGKSYSLQIQTDGVSWMKLLPGLQSIHKFINAVPQIANELAAH